MRREVRGGDSGWSVCVRARMGALGRERIGWMEVLPDQYCVCRVG